MRYLCLICCLLIIVLPAAAQNIDSGTVLELEVEDALFEDAILRTTVEPTILPSPTPRPQQNRFLHGAERERFEQTGVVIRTIPPFLSQPVAIGLQIDDQDLIFDAFTPEAVTTATTTYAATATQPFGYQIVVWERTPLQNLAGEIIPATICTGSGNPCTSEQAAEWVERDKYGLGYRVFGTNTLSDFLPDDHYRVFPSAQKDQTPAVVQYDRYAETTQQSTLELRLHIPPSFQQGTYTNDVVMIVMPTL